MNSVVARWIFKPQEEILKLICDFNANKYEVEEVLHSG
jgi:hypothetical protein